MRIIRLAGTRGYTIMIMKEKKEKKNDHIEALVPLSHMQFLKSTKKIK